MKDEKEMNEREQLKAEIMEEILEELAKKSNKPVPALENVRKKWFNGPDKRFKYSNSKMQQVFGDNQHRVWDAIRSLTRLVFNKSQCSQLRDIDQEKVEKVANSICEMVYSLAKEECDCKN